MTNDSEWTIVSHEDALGYYKDRVLLLLRPQETPYWLHRADVPASSVLLTTCAKSPPRERVLHLPTLSTSMMDAYIEIHRARVYIADCTWEDEIKLAITGDVLRDHVAMRLASNSLQRMVQRVHAGDMNMFSHDEYMLAKDHRKVAGEGKRLLEILDGVWKKKDVVLKE